MKSSASGILIGGSDDVISGLIYRAEKPAYCARIEGLSYHFCKVFSSFDHNFGVNDVNGVNGKNLTFWSFLSSWYRALRKHEIWHHDIFLASDQSRKGLPFQNLP